MSKFHINNEGKPMICKATKGECPFGQHFYTMNEAEAYVNNLNEETYGLLPFDKFMFENKYLNILSKLKSFNYDAYIVGGSLRDTLLNIPTNDIDIATSATPDEVIATFDEYQVIPIGIEHGTVAIVIDNEPIEITTFRHDGEYSDSRRPDSVSFTTSIEEDIKRRDFTINALAYDENGLLDLVNGAKDIEHKLIRAVGDPNERFQEDPLRIMRGLRFASKLGFDIEANTEKAIFDNKHLLKNISAERLQNELNGLLLGQKAGDILNKYSSVISEIVPEIKPMIGFDQKNPHHLYDVWKHSTIVVDNAKDDLAHRLAAVFHDAGKPNTFIYDDDKQYASFLGHAEESVKIADRALRNLKYDNKIRERILNIIGDHDFGLSTKPYKIKKAIYELGPKRFNDMIDFKKADDLSKDLNYKNELYKYDKIKKITEDYLKGAPILSHKDLDIKPKDLMDIGIKGKQLGDVLNELALLVISGHKNERESQIKYVENNILQIKRT